MSDTIELYRQFNQKQEKYTYYIIALSVASIGYSVHMTDGIGLNIYQVPLAIAVSSWGASVYLGLRFIRSGLSVIYDNMDLIKMNEGTHPVTGQNLEMIAVGRETILEIINNKSDTSATLHKWQNRTFYFGMVSFIIWRIIEMYLLTI